ncbi:MAG: site-specific integrase [Candidatus Hydrogenedens sp.]|nr:site-specific integrase [Candidatus Hydrogenedens sp.]
MNTPKRPPKIAYHRGVGQYFYRLDGKFFYLGTDRQEAERCYRRDIARWYARDCRPPAPPQDEITITELLALYVPAFKRECPKGTHMSTVLYWLGEFERSLGGLPAIEFGPLALRRYRESLCDGTPARRSVNRRIQVIKNLFQWAVMEELLPGGAWEALRAVKGLRRGKAPGTYEPEPVRPVLWEHVAETLPHLPRPLRDLVEVLWHTGARCGELLALKAGDLDRSGPVWTYSPQEHKTSAWGHTRVVCFGPEAQAVLRRAMMRHGMGCLFPPSDAIKEWAEGCRTHRRPDQKPNTNESGRTLGDHYRTDTVGVALRRAIQRCNEDRAGRGLAPIPAWHLHQMRHSYATRARQQFGIEAARAALGHKDAGITLTYAEMDKNLAATVAATIG